MKNQAQDQKVICDDQGCRIVSVQGKQQHFQLPDGSIGTKDDMNAYDRR